MRSCSRLSPGKYSFTSKTAAPRAPPALRRQLLWLQQKLGLSKSGSPASFPLCFLLQPKSTHNRNMMP